MPSFACSNNSFRLRASCDNACSARQCLARTLLTCVQATDRPRIPASHTRPIWMMFVSRRAFRT
jgi:hypothetical protein